MPGAGEAIFVVCFATIGLIIAAYPIIKLVGWWLDGGVEPIAALLGIFLYIALIAGVASAPSVFKLLFVAILVISAVLMPMFGQISEDVQNARLEEERMTNLARALEINPMNHAARMGLAEALHRRGELDQAIEQMTWTLEQSPGLAFRIRPELDSWKREKERIGVAPTVICHMCHAENLPGAEQCEACGAMFGTKTGILQRVAQEGGPRVVVRAWIATASWALLACFAFVYLPHYVPIEIIGVMLLASVIVGAWLFLRWVGGDMGKVVEE